MTSLTIGVWNVRRQKMYKFFMSLKQPDGSFLVSHHGEVDVRSVYLPCGTEGVTARRTSELLWQFHLHAIEQIA